MAIELNSRVEVLVGAWARRIGTVVHVWAPVTLNDEGDVSSSCLVQLDGSQHTTMLDTSFLRELAEGVNVDRR